jgi:flagellar biosynthesis/type III secretory pathway protein FliH
MSGLIKGGATHSVRSFLDPAVLPAAPVRDPRIEALEREVGELRAALAAQRLESEQAVKAARAEGEREGRAAADDASDKRLALIGKGIESAVARWETRLVDLDGLAPALARAALGKLFDQGEDQKRFVAGAIVRQLRLLRRESLIAIRVSASDFADESALAALAAEAGTGSVRLLADRDLESGECRIDLQLGHIDVGAGTQWAQVAAFLDGLAEREGSE